MLTLYDIYKTIEHNRNYVNALRSVFEGGITDVRRMQMEILRFIVRLITKSESLLRLEMQFKDFIMGMHELIQRRLSPLLISEERLKQTLKGVQHQLT
jgi:hypothetical protein